MANVLPKETLHSAWREFKGRLILVSASVLIVAATIAGLSLLPAYFILQIEKGYLNRGGVPVSAPPGLDVQSQTERDDIIRSQNFLAHIAPFISATSSPTKILNIALALKPDGVSISNVSFSSIDRGRITITGEAVGREEINQYREALATDGSFSSVSIPFDALAGVGGGKFTITLIEAL